MKRSMRRHLSLMSGIAILVAGLVAAAASFELAYAEAKEFQDDMLRQIASLASDSPPPIANAAANKMNDPESRVWVIHLPQEPRPVWLGKDLSPGFHTLAFKQENLRIYIRDSSGARRTVVAQATDARDEIAFNSAWRTLLPLLFLLPVLIWLIARIVRRELAPVILLASNFDAQPADDPRPVSTASLPEEITPFVHALNRLLHRVNVLMGQQRRFIADAAHELRSPLTALSVQAENVARAESLEASRARIAPLQEGIRRAVRLVEQLLNLARVQIGAQEKMVVDIDALTRELIADYLPLAEVKQIDLGLEANTPLTLETSAEGLQLILRNALDNALKYAPPGGRVTLRVIKKETELVFEVEDNGTGIPVADRERVFDAFHRLADRSRHGSGLGLSIAREAALRLGGQLSLDSPAAGPGLIFRYRQNRL